MGFNSMLVVCPATLKTNWEREIEKWSTTPVSFSVAQGRKFVFDHDANVHIINYDIVNAATLSTMLPRYDLVVYDEMHYCKNPKSQRSKNTLGAGGVITRGNYHVGLSGTPMNKPVELFPIIKALSPESVDGMDYWRYARRYCAMKETPWGKDVNGASNLADLQRRLRSHFMIRRLKCDVLKELPERRYQIIELGSNKETEKILKLEKNIDTAPFLGGNLKGYEIGEIAALRKQLTLAKLSQCLDHIKNLLESVDKLVVFAHHKSVIDQMMEALEKYNPVRVTGDTSQKKRQHAVDSFQEDESVRVFIGNIQAAGVGITLTAASNVVFVESSWVPGEIAQAVDRCHRIGQKNSVLAQFLVVEGSIDSAVLSTALRKVKVIDKTLDGDK
jgi:SWI/SNF-related matrix-associated actin-dependent regulator 1 of chromatin subfamily A